MLKSRLQKKPLKENRTSPREAGRQGKGCLPDAKAPGKDLRKASPSPRQGPLTQGRGKSSGQTQAIRQLKLTLLFTAVVFSILVITTLLCILGVLLLTHIGFPPVQHMHMFPLLALLLACTLVGTTLSAIVSKHTVAPLKKLMDATDRIAEGDYSVRVSMRGPSEFRMLGEKFNHMAQELESVEILRNDFVNNFSHEFKTPIVSIRGFAKALEWEGLSEENRREYLTIIIEESQRLAQLSEKVLALSKVEQQTILTGKERVHVSEQLRLSIAMLAQKWEEKNIKLRFDCPQELFCVGNGELLRQVWINLLDNGIKFSPPGGTIQIEGRSLSSPQERTPDYLSITLKDEGCGMTQEDLHHIYDKFYQGDASRSQPGNGLGMCMVKKILDLHQGEIEIQSQPGEGTVITVLLPCD